MMLPTGVLVIAAALFLSDSVSHADELDFALGKALFDRNWVSAPSSTG